MSIATSINPLTDRTAWLAERRKGIGASEAAMALNASPYGGAHKLYLLKTGQIEPDPETEAMRWGNRLESAIAEEYAFQTGRTIAAQQLFLSNKEFPFLLATVDAIDSADELVEFKTCGPYSEAGKELGEEESDDIPFHWILQAHQQMFVAERDRVNFAVLIGGQRFRRFVVERNEDILADMIPDLCEFWDRVQRRDPPECTELYSPKMLAAINPKCYGTMPIEGGLLDIFRNWEEFKIVAKEAGDQAELAKATLLQALGNHQFGALPDGRRVKRYLQHMKARVNTVDAHVRHYIQVVKGE